VTVKNSDGTTRQVQVTTGLKDYQNTEITSGGLTAGQTVLITKTVSTATTTTAAPGGGFGGLGGALR